MSFNLPEPATFINIKLTDAGRRQISLGSLQFATAILSDREVNYSINNGQSTNLYDITMNRIIAPKDNYPTFTNFDGSTPIALGPQQVVSARQIATASTTTAGLFTYNSSSNTYSIDYTKVLGANQINYFESPINGGNTVTLSTNALNVNTLFGYTPQVGDLMFANWSPVQNSAFTQNNGDYHIQSDNPTNMLWYRVSNVDLSNVPQIGLTLDRNIPNFGAASLATNQTINVYFFPGTPSQNTSLRPFNGVDNDYGISAYTDSKVWNMNIVKTQSHIGGESSDYLSYGSIEYNGAKHFFGFDENTPAVGIIHYTNEYTGNTYAEEFVEQSFAMSLPTIMWHKNGSDNGVGQSLGLSLFDVDGDTFADPINFSTYRYLKDGISSTSNIVGRVYHKLKMAVITDQELLAAMSYKSNRSYTLPQLNLTLTQNPKFPLTTSQASGLCQTNYTYFVTYVVESDSQFENNQSYGYQPTLHCASIAQIDGVNDANGNPQFLNCSFPSHSFPFLRNSTNMSSPALSGTGWNANRIQILVNEQLTTSAYELGQIPSLGWQRISGGFDNSVTGNGIYTGDTTDITIDPVKLAGYNFTISQQDYNSGYTNNGISYQMASDLTTNTDVLDFGDEAFVFGTIDVNILATTFKSIITVTATNAEFNSSLNDTFDSTLDSNTYITEIGIYDNNSNLVAIGKPTYPIKKSSSRYLIYQLELDF